MLGVTFIYESAASVNRKVNAIIGAVRRRLSAFRYTTQSRMEDRSTLESEPSAGPDRNNGAGSPNGPPLLREKVR
jgi:hypothetical protein